MEVDELLSRFHDDAFETYRDALKDASAISSVMISTGRKKRGQPKAAASATGGPLSDPASIPSADGNKTIMRPEYEPLTREKNELAHMVQQLSIEHAVAERRLLVADDAEFAREKRKLDDLAKQLLDYVARLSNLLAYEVILTRQMPESNARKETRAAEDALSKRAQALNAVSSSLSTASDEDERRRQPKLQQKKVDSILEEAEDLYREARGHVEQSRQVWPGRYDYVVIKPPRLVAAPPSALKKTDKVKKKPASPLVK